MTIHATFNPLGSTHPKDLIDNAQNIDYLIIGPANAYPDRLGANRLSWAGIEASFATAQAQRNVDFNVAQAQRADDYELSEASRGYENPVPYAAGISLTRVTQLVQYGSELYKAKPGTLPWTTTGVWATDSAKLASVGDNALRQTLASETGTSNIGDGQLMLDERLLRDLKNFAQLSANGNQLVDLHYGICRGTGWIPGEVGTIFNKPATQVSSYAVSVPDTLGFLVGQLVVYTAANGEYYTAVIIDITVLQISFSQPIESPLGPDSTLGSFYNDYIHPNLNGYRAIADYALRRANREHKLVHTFDLGTTVPVAGGVQTPLTDDTYNNPGGVTSPALLSVAPGIGSGWETAQATTLPAGEYILRLRIATRATPGLWECNINIDEDIAGASLVATTVVSSSRARFVEIPFRARKGGKYKLRVQGTVAGQAFITSKADVLQVTVKNRSLDYGVHVLFGDSWFNLPGIFERLQERMPNATIYNQGVQGHKMIDLVNRWENIEALNPDFVWLMCGTNDYVANVSPTSFFTSFGYISSHARAIGAAMICFNSSVGPIDHPTHGGVLLRRSRALVYDEQYLEEL